MWDCDQVINLKFNITVHAERKINPPQNIIKLWGSVAVCDVAVGVSDQQSVPMQYVNIVAPKKRKIS